MMFLLSVEFEFRVFFFFFFLILTKPPSMANANQSVRTCVLKVDLKCCSGCQKKAKTKLLSISGVSEAEYNQEKELLIVTGDVEPMTLVHKLTKWGRKSELVSVKYQLDDQISDADEEEDTSTSSSSTSSSSSSSSSNTSSNPDPKSIERDTQEIMQMMNKKRKKKKGIVRKYLLLGCFSKNSEVVKPFTIPRNYHLPSKFENYHRPPVFGGPIPNPATSAWRHPQPQMQIHQQQPQFPMTVAAMQYNGYHPQYPMTGSQMPYNGYMFGSAPPPTQPYGISKEALAVNPRLHYQ